VDKNATLFPNGENFCWVSNNINIFWWDLKFIHVQKLNLFIILMNCHYLLFVYNLVFHD
jgi:hypothetical protein